MLVFKKILCYLGSLGLVLLEPFDVFAGWEWLVSVRGWKFIDSNLLRAEGHHKRDEYKIWDGVWKRWQWHWIQSLMGWIALWSPGTAFWNHLYQKLLWHLPGGSYSFMRQTARLPFPIFLYLAIPVPFRTLKDRLISLGPSPNHLLPHVCSLYPSVLGDLCLQEF